MQTYPVRASHRGNLDPAALERILGTHLESVARAGSDVTASYGAIVRLAAHADGKSLAIDVTTNPKVPADVAAETVRRYNRFLEEATGFTAKERAKRLRKSAGAGE